MFVIYQAQLNATTSIDMDPFLGDCCTSSTLEPPRTSVCFLIAGAPCWNCVSSVHFLSCCIPWYVNRHCVFLCTSSILYQARCIRHQTPCNRSQFHPIWIRWGKQVIASCVWNIVMFKLCLVCIIGALVVVLKYKSVIRKQYYYVLLLKKFM